jgi:hypothetical protein
VLNSPHVDFLSSPPQYERRSAGEPGLFQSGYFGSYRLHDKVFWQEADIRTHLVQKPVHYRAWNLAETLGVLDRQFGHALTEMNGVWWFTLAGDKTFSDAAIMSRISRISEAAGEAILHRGTRRRDVAIFSDEQIYARLQMGPKALMLPLVTEMRRMLAHSGVPHDFYLLPDVAHPDLPDYRMYVFLNCLYVPDKMRKAIAAKVKRENAVAVWFYAPGFIGGEGRFDDDNMEHLTGIRVKHVRRSYNLALDIKHPDHPITRDHPPHVPGTREPVDPVFFADDPDAVVLGALTGIGKPGLVIREFDNWRSVYLAGPTMTPELFRNLARYAGCHVYSETNDVFNANSRYLMLHVVSPGRKTIILPWSSDVEDVMTGELVGNGTSRISFDAARVGDTRLFQLLK